MYFKVLRNREKEEDKRKSEEKRRREAESKAKREKEQLLKNQKSDNCNSGVRPMKIFSCLIIRFPLCLRELCLQA